MWEAEGCVCWETSRGGQGECSGCVIENERCQKTRTRPSLAVVVFFGKQHFFVSPWGLVGSLIWRLISDLLFLYSSVFFSLPQILIRAPLRQDYRTWVLDCVNPLVVVCWVPRSITSLCWNPNPPHSKGLIVCFRCTFKLSAPGNDISMRVECNYKIMQALCLIFSERYLSPCCCCCVCLCWGSSFSVLGVRYLQIWAFGL